MPCWIMTALAWPVAYCLAFTDVAGPPNDVLYAFATFYFLLGAFYLVQHMRGLRMAPC